MIYFKTIPEDDPYYSLWHSKEWLHPFDNLNTLKFPRILTVEPVNICQNDCVYCSMNIMDRVTGVMSLDTMKKIAFEASEHGASIRFGGFGEPLINKDFPEFIKICKENEVRTTLFTNGKLLNEENMKKFCEYGLDEIRFSGSGMDKETHERVRVGSDYEKDFKEKIIMADNIRKKMNTNKPYFTIYTHVYSYDDESFKKNKQEYIDFYMNYVDKIDIDLTNLSRVKEIDEVKEHYDKQTIKQVYKPCVTLYHKFIIHWNGDVFACDIPYSFQEEYFLGNLNDNISMYDMYHSDKIKDLRIKTQNLEHNDLPLCKDCYSNTNKYDELKGCPSE